MTSFERHLREKIIVLYGATGTNLQLMNLTADDFGGEALNGCNEHRVFTRPDTIEKLHACFLGGLRSGRNRFFWIHAEARIEL